MTTDDQANGRPTDPPGGPDPAASWRRAWQGVRRGLWIAVAAGVRLARLDIVTRSSHLAYLTVFGMVPLLVIAVALMRPLGLLQNARQDIHDFLATTGVTRISLQLQTQPTPGRPSHPVILNLGEEIERLIHEVMTRLTVGRVGPLGTLVLAWAAISLVTTLEKTLNLIFGARQTRPLGQRFLLYWSVVTLVPIVIVAVSLPAERAIEHIEAFSWVSRLTGWFAYIAPTLAGILIVAGIYKFLPNTYVPFKAGLVGAAFAVPIWVLAKKGFGFYLKHLMVSGSLYGALGLLPVFLVYVNMSWLILLWGAQLADTAYHSGRVRIGQVWELAIQPTDLLAAILHVARYFQAGLGPAPFHEISRQIDLPDDRVRAILDYLETRRLAHRLDDRRGGHYTLARPAEKIRMLEVLEADTRQGFDALKNRYSVRTALTIFWLQEQAQSRADDLTLADALARERETGAD